MPVAAVEEIAVADGDEDAAAIRQYRDSFPALIPACPLPSMMVRRLVEEQWSAGDGVVPAVV